MGSGLPMSSRCAVSYVSPAKPPCVPSLRSLLLRDSVTGVAVLPPRARSFVRGPICAGNGLPGKSLGPAQFQRPPSSWEGKRKGNQASGVAGRPVQDMSPVLPAERKGSPQPEYIPGPLDDFFLKVFREKMAEEVGWDSPKPGYDGLLEVVRRLYTTSSKPETEKATVRVFTAVFPSWLAPLFRQLILPIASGKAAAIMMAVVTKATCQWLMGSCIVNQVTLADGSTIPSGVLVQECKYLKEIKCAGICTHTCKIPTQAFIQEGMGVPLAMEPNFNDFSCQFKFGVEALPRDQDPGLQTPCLSICPTAVSRSTLGRQTQLDQCPQVQ